MGSSGRPKSYDSRFMQPIIPGFLTSFSIPLAYKEKIAEEGYEEAERLVLVHEMEPKKSDWKWEVEIEEGRHFKQGWTEFCEDHNLSVGEFVVFTHLRDLVFRVSVYDPATVCERQFPQFSRHPIKLNEKRDTFNHTSRRIKSLKVVETASTLLPHSKSKDSSFDVKLTSRSLKTRMNLPMAFVRSNEHFYRRCCQTKLIDGKGKSWQVKLNYSKSNGQSYISQGWKDFKVGNNLKPGNVIRFEVLEGDGEMPAMKCYRLKKRDGRLISNCSSAHGTKPVEGEAATTEVQPDKSQHQSCKVTMTQYLLKSANIHLPVNFVRSNGLFRRQCDIELIDRKGRSWQAKLNYRKGIGQPYICQGWKAFQAGNSMKPGDLIYFKFLKDGKRPTIKCYKLTSRKKHNYSG